MLHQIIEERPSKNMNTGTMGFNDYETVFTLTFEQFVSQITEKYNKPNIKVINISYLNQALAVVVYKDKNKKQVNTEL